MFVDTHCHIHDSEYDFDIKAVLDNAQCAGVGKMICVGTNLKASHETVNLAQKHDNIFATVGVHPHDTKHGVDGIFELARQEKVVAVGEIGLDYYYNNSPRETQIKMLEQQLQMARDLDLPVVFHVRDAFDDFWPVVDNFSGITGVLHSFTDTTESLKRAEAKGLYIGVNGISTFTKQASQIEMFSQIPLEMLLLETDAPFLTPAPFRGKINEPSMVVEVAKYHAKLRGIDLELIAQHTTKNAESLFGI